MADQYLLDVLNVIADFCDKYEIRHEDDCARGLISANIKLHGCMIPSVETVFRTISLMTTGVMVCAYFPWKVNEKRRAAIAEYISRINYGMIRQGNFEIDFRDGEVRYKMWLDCNEKLPSFRMIGQSIAIEQYMFKCYGNGLVNTMKGVQNAEEAAGEVLGGGAF